MKKVTALIMSAVMMLCVCSACGTKKEQVNSPQQASNSTETKTEEQEKVEEFKDPVSFNLDVKWMTPVVENESSIYYVSESGIVQVEKSDYSEKEIISFKGILGLIWYNDDIYFYDKDEIHKFNFESKTGELVWNKAMLPKEGRYTDFGEIHGAYIYDGYIYIKDSQISAIRVKLGANETEEFLNDFDVLDFYQNYCYYIEHAGKSFSVFRKELSAKESQMVLGDGRDRYDKEKTRYSGVAVVGGEIYYSMNEPSKVCKYISGKDDDVIFDLSDRPEAYVAVAPFSRNNKLYYSICDDGSYDLYEYDPINTQNKLLKAASNVNGQFIVIDQTLIYYDDNSRQLLHMKL